MTSVAEHKQRVTDAADRPEERRAYDRAIADLASMQMHLHECMEKVKTEVVSVKAEVATNTEITTEVRDIITWFETTFKLLGKAAGIITVAGGAAFSVLQILRFFGVL